MKYRSAINIDREALTSLMALRLRTKDNYIRFSKLGEAIKAVFREIFMQDLRMKII